MSSLPTIPLPWYQAAFILIGLCIALSLYSSIYLLTLRRPKITSGLAYLLLATFLEGFLGLFFLIDDASKSWWLALSFFPIVLLFGYASTLLLTFAAWLKKPKITPPIAAIIVLGANVTFKIGPLLQRRLDTAIALGQQMPQVPVIMSGGQGVDEPCTEASAMAEYASENGLPETQIWQEDKSVSTKENLIFSSELLAKEAPERSGDFLVVTNSFHLWRTKRWLKHLNLPGQVIPAPTKSWYWPVGSIREYVAIVYTRPWLLAILLLLALTPTVLVAAASF
ncbi:hypothetical protein BK816_05410 [Boudabousia tangfeifanii]|uniref:DUF218 domain-containing protein n=1 Tax=Boudabousia tangfeifanii TaxID=1912795 RepID=A0A1D9MKC7_9ACTO|nr:YdcF family protein [Boudabousia tangfeifanii]AOZ72801.1 hypothetical protein BK816_05410 [Boudabousia tangfeifanii]